MIWWLVDHANVSYIVLGLAGIIFLALFWNSGRIKNLVIVGLIALIGLLFWLLTENVVTDRGQIRTNMDQIAFGALKRDSKNIQKYLSDTFEYGDLRGKKETADHLVATALHFEVNGYKISNFEVDEPSRERKEAKFFFRLHVDAEDGQFLGACRGTFVLEGETWRLKTIQMYKFIGDAEQPFQPSLH